MPRRFPSWLQWVISDLVAYLETWQPSGSELDPTPEGLARALAHAVREDPARFAEAADAFADVEPVYVRGILDGLEEAAERGRPFPWGPVLELALHLVEKPRGLPEHDGGSRLRDLTYGRTRLQLARLMRIGLSISTPYFIDYELRERVWAVLQALMSDPDPTLERDSEFPHNDEDPFQLANSSVRAAALLAIFTYGTWVRSGILQASYSGGASWNGFDSAPEVGNILIEHLDRAVDPSLSVRAIYGWQLPLVTDLDTEWVKAHEHDLFPS